MTKRRANSTIRDPSTERSSRSTESKGEENITPHLTFSVDGPTVVDLRTATEAAALGPITTSEQAAAVRPRLDDPTRLANGDFHPRYAQWIMTHSWAQQHPLSDYLSKESHLRLLCDERGFFDRKRVNRVLGSSGSKIWLVDGPLPTRAKVPLLAQLLDAPVGEVQAVVEEERTARSEYQAMVSGCRMMPYKLLSYEQVRAGVPCPGCGRPWVGPQDDLDRDRDRWHAVHGECSAGRNGYNDAPVHCLRCCGVPPLSPKQIAAVSRIFQEAFSRREGESRLAATVSPEVKRQQQEMAATKRAKRIEKLEAELARLRAEESTDIRVD